MFYHFPSISFRIMSRLKNRCFRLLPPQMRFGFLIPAFNFIHLFVSWDDPCLVRKEILMWKPPQRVEFLRIAFPIVFVRKPVGCGWNASPFIRLSKARFLFPDLNFLSLLSHCIRFAWKSSRRRYFAIKVSICSSQVLLSFLSPFLLIGLPWVTPLLCLYYSMNFTLVNSFAEKIFNFL